MTRRTRRQFSKEHKAKVVALIRVDRQGETFLGCGI